jgi:hypothetical protein
MNLFIANCRGLGLDATIGKLRDLFKSYNPEVVFLCETKKKSREMDRLKWSLGFPHGVAVDCNGKSGGLALWWKEGVEVSVRPWCQYYIDAEICLNGKRWRFSGMYGEPKTELRARTWEALQYLRSQDDLPWLCAGDFNEILFPHEQLGGNPRNINQMTTFSDCLADCNLTDLGYAGYDFTWNNRMDGPDNILVRLDRGTATASFLDLYPMTAVEHIAMEGSDHMALLIRIADVEPKRSSSGSRGFQFEEMWLKHEGYEDMVFQAWENRDKGERGINGL